MALKIDDISINTIIGSGSSISGDVHINGFIRIDGDIDGNLETDGNVIIGENARIQGNLKAKSVIIGGIILGNVHAAENVKLLSNAVVIGDILSHKVQIEDKSTFHGHCISIRDSERYQTETDKYLQSKAIKEKVVLA
ncbi:MAG: polymer-forming cytoskeletal protein [Treponema sp.]|nr:polymer-forming cytoskeletal protein [Treponema sp.]